MSTTPYTSVSVTGYNSNPPPDDGTRSAANQVKYATTKEKLADPLNTAVEAINTNVGTAFAAVQTYLAGHIQGFTTSNSSGDADHDIDIAAGVAVDSTGVEVLQLATAITKRIDAVWAVGTGNGGLDTGSVAVSTWYYVFAIKRSDTGVVDGLFSTSATSPTLPTDYDYFRRIGAVLTDGSGSIIGYAQFGDFFGWKAVPVDLNSSTVGTTASSVTLSVPTGITTVARIQGLVRHLSSTPGVFIVNPSVTSNDVNAPTTYAAGNFLVGFSAEVLTSSTGQVDVSASVNSTIVTIGTVGWTDSRGKS